MVAGMSTWVLDLDGVVWRGDRIVDGSDRAVSALLAAGHQVVACTNHAQSPAVKGRTLARLGVPEIPVVTSAEAAASRCPEGSSVLVLGDESLVAVIAASGLEAIDVFDLPDGSVPRVDVVVVGGTHRWDRSRVGMAAAAVRLGALFLATNDDPTYPVCGPDGDRLLPGNGALVAAVATTAEVAAEVTGKPHPAMVQLLQERFGQVDVVVGDKADTDGELALRLGARFALVLSGVTGPDSLPVRPSPSWIAPDLATLVHIVGSVG